MKRNLIIFLLSLFLINCLQAKSYSFDDPTGQSTVLKGGVKESVVEEKPKTGIGVVGLRFIHMKGYPSYIKEVYLNSPASAAGIIPSDLIYAINGIPTHSQTSDGIYGLLSGLPGSKVDLTIMRNGKKYSSILTRVDLSTFSSSIQNYYLNGPVAVPFDPKDVFGY